MDEHTANDPLPTPERDGVSRRQLLKTGAGGLAAAALIQITGFPGGSRRAEAAAIKPDPATLRPADPHAGTARRGGPTWRSIKLTDESPQARVLPIENAKFLLGARFDLRVEAYDVDPDNTEIEIHVQGPNGPAEILHDEPETTSAEPNSLEVTYRGILYDAPGEYRVHAQVRSNGGSHTTEARHEVVAADIRGRKAKNVIFFLGDGMGQPAITAARILSKGITEGKYHGLLEMDQLDYRGFVGTSGVDSIATDSANSMSAYTCGHKSSVNAMGVYESNEPDADGHPRVENITELLKRVRDMAIGVVTTSEIQDATPAAVWAHTRRRAEYVEIMEQALDEAQRPDVLMGGGTATLLPQSDEESTRDDDRDLREEFRALGYEYASTRAELRQAMQGSPPSQLLGTFHPGNLNVYLDRQHSPDPEVLGEYDDQPNLMEMTEAALAVLEQRDEGFFLMVEGASIDKMEHPMDGSRVVYDTIEFDQAIGVAKRWAQDRDDTLIVVTADHNHSMSIVGTHDRRDNPNPDRQGNGVYGDAGFPTYSDDDGDGFPDDPDPDVQLFYGWSNHPDHTDDFQHNDRFDQPALLDESDRAVDNPERDPDAQEQIGNLPYDQTNCVHTVEDVAIFASGPGAERFNAFLDNTEVFYAMMDALGLEVPIERDRPGRDRGQSGDAPGLTGAAPGLERSNPARRVVTEGAPPQPVRA